MASSDYKDTKRVLVLHRGLTYGTTVGHQALPFAQRGGHLRDRGIAHFLERATEHNAKLDAIDRLRPDAVIDFPHWSQPYDDLRETVKEVRSRFPGLGYALVDFYDQSSSPHMPLVDDVDCYAKRQVLADRSLYTKSFKGGYIFTDFLVNSLGYDIGDWHFGATLSREQAERIFPIWNLGAVERYRRIANVSRWTLPYRMRPIRFNLRLGLTQRTKHEEWYQQYRRFCLDKIQPLIGNKRATGQARISSKAYYAELQMSRVVFSPFGWGEVCFRDYEAVASGCLLLKQDMSHIETWPNIYQPYETYIPLKWDLSDLGEAIEWIHQNPKRCAEIARNGHRWLLTRYASGELEQLVSELIDRTLGPDQSRGESTTDGSV